jgi:hypothetical protein
VVHKKHGTYPCYLRTEFRRADALEHAEGERGHAAAFAREGRKIGVEDANSVDAKHWKRLREAFMRCIAERDLIGCPIVQEIMLESFAVASYARVGRVALEGRFEPFSQGRVQSHRSGLRRWRLSAARHGIYLAPLYNAAGPLESVENKSDY